METINNSPTQAVLNYLPKANVSTMERILMIAGGTYLLYKALNKNEKDFGKSTLASTMITRGLSGYCPVYKAIENIKEHSNSNVNIRIKSYINQPVSKVYNFWRNLENLPRFMNHLESVTKIDNTTSTWVTRGIAGVGKLSWNAEIVSDEKDKQLSWHSLPDASVENAGKVLFSTNGMGTDLDVTISYRAPLGIIGEEAAKLLNPFFTKMVKDDIENFKTYLESGHLL